MGAAVSWKALEGNCLWQHQRAVLFIGERRNDCLEEETGCPGLPDCCLLISDSSAFGTHERSRHSSHSIKDLQGVQKLNRDSSQQLKPMEGRRGNCSRPRCHWFLLQTRRRQRKEVCENATPSPTSHHKAEPCWLKTSALQNVFYCHCQQSDVHPSALNLEGGWIIHSPENKKTNKPLSYFISASEHKSKILLRSPATKHIGIYWYILSLVFTVLY